MATRKSSYTPMPAVPRELLPRLVAIVEVLAGTSTVSAAARSLGLSRNHFQSILHRAVSGAVGAITAKPGGRPGQPPAISSLQRELARLKRENTRLQRQVNSTDKLLDVAAGLLRGRIRPTSRQRRTRPTGTPQGDRDDADPERRRQRTLESIDELCRIGMSARAASGLAGINSSTLRRWRARRSVPMRVAPRGRGECVVPPSAILSARATELVRRLHGLIGAEALRHSVEGLSRRVAARVKAEALSAMEHERKANLVRVRVMRPGVLRSIDAMRVPTSEDPMYALISADGAIPYRTSLTVAQRYDTALVLRALREDFEHQGAPLVLRLDRARAHDAPGVRDLLRQNGVLLLHGPPHYPCFYGQLERQNREHRAWIDYLPLIDRDLLEPCLIEMLQAVNDLWRRRILNWQTAAEAWSTRPPLIVSRDLLREEVHDRAIRIAFNLRRRGEPADLAERIAIERTLQQRGYLRLQPGGWC
jgi:transposase-like protein